MKRRPRLPKTAVIPPSLDHRLNFYALAAGAAGVSLLALTPPAEAEIIFTPAHVTIGFRGSYDLDIDNDGVADFFIRGYGDGVNDEFVDINVRGGGGVKSLRTCTGSTSYCTYARALPQGAKIAGGRRFVLFARIVGASKRNGNNYSYGPWGNVRDHYLGLKVRLSGQTHYGWARMSVRVQGISITALITGYAYESLPNMPIRAGQKSENPGDAASDSATADPGTLGALAQGSRSVQGWRRHVPAPGTGQ